MVPRWSPEGVWTPPEHGRHQHINIFHRSDCAAGDHVPLAPTDDDEDEDGDGEDAAPAELLVMSPAPAEAATGTTALYRYYDAYDLLLYVGISDRLYTRTGKHIQRSSWMDFAARSTIERFPSREEALTAEEAAIKAERPLFNHQHNASPEAQKRLIEYLVSHGRLDLLAPAVSRG